MKYHPPSAGLNPAAGAAWLKPNQDLAHPAFDPAADLKTRSAPSAARKRFRAESGRCFRPLVAPRSWVADNLPRSSSARFVFFAGATNSC